MFRKMRRKNQLLPQAEAEKIMKNGTAGVLALAGDDGYPYSLPMSYVYDNNRIFFHSAKSGHKIDAIRRCSKASFCVIEKNDIVPHEYTTYYRSAIAFGRIDILEEESAAASALQLLGEKYNPGNAEKCLEEIKRFSGNVCVLCLEIEHITAKAARELLK